MKKQHDINTAFRHIPTEYDSCGLGRDDPVWPRYVTEATKWDAQLVEGWHKGMDVILLFVQALSTNKILSNRDVVRAALFSAIVTAFLIESYKFLQVDNEEIIASNMPHIVELLQAIAANQQPSFTVNATDPLTNFKPATVKVAINAVWFLSLTLSVSVALLAMLVKQWGEGYRHGHDLSPPCVQARVRQARYDELKRWRTEDIALALPVLMHTSLGLFLLGLVLFLGELNHTILALVLVVVILTFMVYLGTTLMPLFMAFCPYDTPLSSRRYWALFRTFFLRIFGSDDGEGSDQLTPQLKCQQEERSISEKTVPDELTVRALEWLIGHSKEGETIDIAIGAISSTVLKMQIHRHLAQDSLVTLLAQKFTAIFNGILDEEKYDSSVLIVDDSQVELDKAALYGRALANVTRHIRIKTVSNRGDPSQGLVTRKRPGSQSTSITLMEDQVKAVERGLYAIALSEEPLVASSGITCLSAWYTSTSRAAQSRDKWKTMLARLIEILSNGSHHGRLYSESTSQDQSPVTSKHKQSTRVEARESIPRADRHASANVLESDMLDRIVHALLLELANWRWDLSKQERRDIIKPLIGLFASPLLDGFSRPGMSAVLAVFAVLFHDHQEFLTETPPLTDGDWVDISGPELDDDSLDLGQSVHKEIDSKDIQPPRSKRRSILAQHIAHKCQTDDEYMRKHTDALLFFGLAGLLDSLSLIGLPEITSQVVEIVTTQLNSMSGAFHSQPILLPSILPPTVDARAFMADAITRSLSPSPFKGQLHPFPEEEKATLLECLWDKSYLWSDFGHQFLMPIVQLLHITQIIPLKDQCLTALNEYCFAHFSQGQYSSPYHVVDWRFFFSLDVPYRLAEIMNEHETLLSKAVATFDSIMQTMPKDTTSPQNGVDDQISAAISRLAMGSLLSKFAEAVLCRHGIPHVQTWRDRLVNLPKWLDSTGGLNSESVKTKLYQFCAENVKKPGQMTILALGLRDKLDEQSPQRQPGTSSAGE